MGIKQTITYETIKRERCYVLYKESIIIIWNPDLDFDDITGLPRILGVFTTEEKAREYAKIFLEQKSFGEEAQNPASSSWTSKSYQDEYGNILTLNLVTMEIDREYGEITYLPIATL